MLKKIVIVYIQLILFLMTGCVLIPSDISPFLQSLTEDDNRKIDESFLYHGLDAYFIENNEEEFVPYDEDKGLIAIGGIVRVAKYRNKKYVRHKLDMETLVKLGDIISEIFKNTQGSNSSITTLPTSEVRERLGSEEFKLMIDKIRDSEFHNLTNTLSGDEWTRKYKKGNGYTKYNILNRTFKIKKLWRSKLKAKYLLFGRLDNGIIWGGRSEKGYLGMDIILYNLNSGNINHLGNFSCSTKMKNGKTLEELFARSFHFFPTNFEDQNKKFYLPTKKQKDLDKNNLKPTRKKNIDNKPKKVWYKR